VSEALVVSNIVLWVLVVVLSLVVLALVRQVGLLNERVAPVGALTNERGPEIGAPAPEFQLLDLAGREVTLGGADTEGRSTLLFFLSPTCPVCKTLLPTLERVARAENVHLVLASDGEPEPHREFVAAQGIEKHTYVLSTELGMRHQVAKLPHAILIDAAGILRARGMVNTREHLESLFEAARLQVGSIQDYLALESTTSNAAHDQTSQVEAKQTNPHRNEALS
jgi:methylamine dehydrogenase accessory protein MauD